MLMFKKSQATTCNIKTHVNNGILTIWVFPKNRGTPKWMVYNGKPHFLMDDLGVPLFSETSISPGDRRISGCHQQYVKPNDPEGGVVEYCIQLNGFRWNFV